MFFVPERGRSRRDPKARSAAWRAEQSNTVPKEGLEPSHPKAQEPKSCVSTSSTTPARHQIVRIPTPHMVLRF